MSYPFIIWTMQRTGGTALTELLMTMSEHQSAEHEPFNWARPKPRQFWPIADAWNKTADATQLRRSLSELFAHRYLIKHCFELPNMPFNLHLMAVAAESDYRHVLLLRRDEPSRLFSKFIAEAQGTWFKDYASRVFGEVAEGRRKLGSLPVEKMVEHFRHCRDCVETIRANLGGLDIAVEEVYYEDLYRGDPDRRLDRARRLLEFLGFSAEEIAEHDAAIAEALFQKGQNTGAVAQFVPNHREALDALARVGCYPCPEPSGEQDAPACGGEMTDQWSDTTPRQAAEAQGPRVKLVAEVQVLAERFDARGPVLEIVGDARDLVIPWTDRFADSERCVLGIGDTHARDGVTFHAGRPAELRSLFAESKFGTVISNGVLAHDPFFWRTLGEMERVLAPGGMLIVVAPCFSKVPNNAGVAAIGRKGNPVPSVTVTQSVHASPDYWRISPQAMKQVILDGYEVKEVRVAMMPPRVFGAGVKPL